MRCPKCQYVGFEPSPRCKNCGYDLSLGGSLDENPARVDADDDEPSLTLVVDGQEDREMADFELQIFDDVPAKKLQAGAKAFDLDDLLANGPASGSAASRDSEPVIQPVSAVARRRQSSSSSSAASAVATPPPMEIEALFKPAPVVETRVVETPAIELPVAAAPVVPAPVVERPVVEPEPAVEPEPIVMKASLPPEPPTPPAPPAPVTTELPLFMQGMSELSAQQPAKPPVERSRAVSHAPVPASVEAAAGVMIAEASPEAEVDDRPLVQVPASPRAPLAVRRTTPDPARLRAKYSRAARAKAEPIETSGDLLLHDPGDASETAARVDPRIVQPIARMSSEPTPSSLPADWLPGVGPAKRLMAAAVDGVLLLGLDAAVIWFTLSVCGLAPAQANLLPIAPLLLFFLLLDAGYLVLFTAACGQTLGKMAAGIRVVGTTTGAVINDRITIAQALMRSLGSIASMVPLGAGFWFALVGDRRAVHDRLAHTRVVSQ